MVLAGQGTDVVKSPDRLALYEPLCSSYAYVIRDPLFWAIIARQRITATRLAGLFPTEMRWKALKMSTYEYL